MRTATDTQAKVAPGADRDMFWTALGRQPQTLCHLDLHGGNLFTRHRQTRTAGREGRPEAREETVAIDWGSLSLAAAGIELARLIDAKLMGAEGDAAELRRKRRTLFGAYVAGLRDAGWRGDERAVWSSYLAGVALYQPFAIAARAVREATAGRPCGAFATATYVLLDLADEAREWAAA